MADIPDRRRFLSICTTALIAGMSGLILTPVVAFVIGPLRRKAGNAAAESDFADAGVIESIPKGTWTLRPIEIVRQDGWVKTSQSRSVWVFVKSAESNGIKVLSPICPHLGCPVPWDAAASQFRCPCHGGVFGPDGARISGPPPRGLDPLEYEVRGKNLWVRWQDFEIGVAQRIVVQV
ncbi:MAG TPA: ubiquinol-cytochrome c reductase iron-sulfur subunit [Tepidisphaeraceae bacterium]|nr:ubiquinol-cytochrome c reductase iron-sulfur subunit [Tepidisphaeraceae bacterium]